MSSLTLQNRKVLVLNKNWMAVGVATMERAMTLLFSSYKDGTPKARILVPQEEFALYTWHDWSLLKPAEGEDVISVSRGRKFRIPEIVLLTRYDKSPQQRVHFSRRTIYRRDSFTCQYCGCKPGSSELTIDHVIPKCQKGLTSWDNCVLACIQCNTQKAGRRPNEAFKHLLTKEQQKFWKGPSPMKDQHPKKPKFSLFKGDRTVIPKSWSNFVSEVYWETELENDMPETSETFTVDV